LSFKYISSINNIIIVDIALNFIGGIVMSGLKNIYGFVGNILRINLSNGEIANEPTIKYAKSWLGSTGIAVKILYDELKSWVTPYDPLNKLIFGAGPLIGTTAPGANKLNVSTFGPMINGWASSCSDSYLGGELKCAGYDSVVIEGRSHKPVYLWINDGKVEIRDAANLWGKTTWETLDLIRQELGDKTLHTASIGPAGENLCRGACIINDKSRANGRGGVGAVMGSKNLKAIVAKGTGSVKIAEPERFMKAVAHCRDMFKGRKSAEAFHRYGTLGLMKRKQEVSGLIYKNFQDVTIPKEMEEAIDPKIMIDKFEVARQSYPGCALGGCSRICHITEGPYDGFAAETGQWESVVTLQTRFGIEEPYWMLKGNALCNQLGIGLDEAAGAMSWAMECYQRGIITKEDTGGIELNWNDPDLAFELIEMISHRKGFGNLLAEGCARAAEILGRDSDYYALHIKKADLYEPCRGSMGWCLGSTTSTRGGGHTTGAPLCETADAALDVEKAREVYGIESPHKPEVYDGKAKMVTYSESLQRANNAFGICHYNTTYLDPNLVDLKEIAELYSAATGWETSVEDLKKMAMRQLNLEKAFNLRFTDFDRKDDLPAARDQQEPIPSGGFAGWKMDMEKYNKMLDEYYDLHGWDKETSFPKRETLIDLDLENVAEDLAKIGKLR
jgi:aldehyde:ferredoxin oxidoreductase